MPVKAAKNQPPPFDALMWPAIEVLKSKGGSATHAELLDGVVDLLSIPEIVMSVMQSDGSQAKAVYNLRWAEWYLAKYGALKKSAAGVLVITPKGMKLKPDDVKDVVAAVRQTIKRAPGFAEGAIPLDEQAADGWRTTLLQKLKSIRADTFERLCLRILRESGFLRVEITGRSEDGAIDGIGVLRISLLSVQVYFQCRRWRGNAGAKELRDMRGAMAGRSDKGLLITTGGFSAEARKEASRDGAPPIELVDADALCDLLKQLNLGVATAFSESVTVDAQFFDALG